MDPQSLPTDANGKEVKRSSFPLLSPSRLSALKPTSNDAVAKALQPLTESSPIDFTIDQAVEACEQALKLLGNIAPKPAVNEKQKKGKADHDADAYDVYFSIIRVEGNEREVFAQGLLVAFRDLLLDAKSGCSLTPTEWSLIRQGFIELGRLITSEYYLDY